MNHNNDYNHNDDWLNHNHDYQDHNQQNDHHNDHNHNQDQTGLDHNHNDDWLNHNHEHQDHNQQNDHQHDHNHHQEQTGLDHNHNDDWLNQNHEHQEHNYDDHNNTNYDHNQQNDYHHNQDQTGLNYHNDQQEWYHDHHNLTQTESTTINNDNSRHIMLSDSDSHTISLAHTVHIYSDGDVYWDKGGKAGEIKGNVFYNSGGHEIAHLGADWKIYDVNNHQIGYLDSHGYARNMADEIVADQGNARENASQLIYNFASPK